MVLRRRLYVLAHRENESKKGMYFRIELLLLKEPCISYALKLKGISGNLSESKQY